MASRVASSLVALAAVVTVGHCRLLGRDPPAESSDDIDAQIAALNAQTAQLTDQLETAKVDAAKSGVKVEDMADSFDRHCPKETRALLDKGETEVPEAKEAPKGGDFGLLDQRMEASKRQSLVDGEEFLLGLMLMHETRGNWCKEQYLDAMCTLAHESPVITQLYHHHDMKRPFSAQLAEMMDAERKKMAPTKAPPLNGDAVNDLLGSVVALKAAKKK